MPGDFGPFAPLNMPIRQLLFSLRGRIPRSIWWGASAILNFVWLLAFALLVNMWRARSDADTMFGAILIVLMTLVIWTNVALQFKRWQDTGHNGWGSMVAFIPYIGWFIGAAVCGFAKGTVGPNEYGPDPLAANATEPSPG